MRYSVCRIARLLMPLRLTAPVATSSACSRARSDCTSKLRLSVYSSVRCGMSHPFDQRCAARVKRLDRLQAPGLTFPALGLAPHDRLPVRRKNQARPGVGDLKAITARFIHVEKKGLLDRVLVR